jgi:hypothetical protein
MYHLSNSLPEPSSTCLQFFPSVLDTHIRAPDLNLGITADLNVNIPPSKDQTEMPLSRQLLDSSSQSPFSNADKVLEQADLSLSLALPEHSKRPKVNTSLRLFG